MARPDLSVARSCMAFHGFDTASRLCPSLGSQWRQAWELFSSSPDMFLSYDGVPFKAPRKLSKRPNIEAVK